jgi:hypothetical protein
MTSCSLLSKFDQAITILVCVREAPGSNLGQYTRYHDWGFPSSSVAQNERWGRNYQ